MLGLGKKAGASARDYVGGWRIQHYRTMLEHLSAGQPLIRAVLTGYEQTIRFEDARSETKDVVVGTWGRPPAKVLGYFDLGPNADGSLGHVSFTAQHTDDDRPPVPLVELFVRIGDRDQMASLRDALRGSLGAGGTIWANLQVDRVTDVDREMQKMAEDGISSDLKVRAIDFGFGVGEACSSHPSP